MSQWTRQFSSQPTKRTRRGSRMASHNPVEAYGFSSIPRAFSKILERVDTANNKNILVEDLPLPHSNEVAKKAHEYAKEHLPPQTFNHSMRVFLWGMRSHFFGISEVLNAFFNVSYPV